MGAPTTAADELSARRFAAAIGVSRPIDLEAAPAEIGPTPEAIGAVLRAAQDALKTMPDPIVIGPWKHEPPREIAAPEASQPLILSRAEIGAPPADSHPGPWRWFAANELTFENACIKDANGRTLWIEPFKSSQRVRVLTELAPELATLLSEMQIWADDAQVAGVFHTSSDPTKCLHCRVGALLDRIDKAGR